MLNLWLPTLNRQHLNLSSQIPLPPNLSDSVRPKIVRSQTPKQCFPHEERPKVLLQLRVSAVAAEAVGERAPQLHLASYFERFGAERLVCQHYAGGLALTIVKYNVAVWNWGRLWVGWLRIWVPLIKLEVQLEGN